MKKFLKNIVDDLRFRYYFLKDIIHDDDLFRLSAKNLALLGGGFSSIFSTVAPVLANGTNGQQVQQVVIEELVNEIPYAYKINVQELDNVWNLLKSVGVHDDNLKNASNALPHEQEKYYGENHLFPKQLRIDDRRVSGERVPDGIMGDVLFPGNIIYFSQEFIKKYGLNGLMIKRLDGKDGKLDKEISVDIEEELKHMDEFDLTVIPFYHYLINFVNNNYNKQKIGFEEGRVKEFVPYKLSLDKEPGINSIGELSDLVDHFTEERGYLFNKDILNKFSEIAIREHLGNSVKGLEESLGKLDQTRDDKESDVKDYLKVLPDYLYPLTKLEERSKGTNKVINNTLKYLRKVHEENDKILRYLDGAREDIENKPEWKYSIDELSKELQQRYYTLQDRIDYVKGVNENIDNILNEYARIEQNKGVELARKGGKKVTIGPRFAIGAGVEYNEVPEKPYLALQPFLTEKFSIGPEVSFGFLNTPRPDEVIRSQPDINGFYGETVKSGKNKQTDIGVKLIGTYWIPTGVDKGKIGVYFEGGPGFVYTKKVGENKIAETIYDIHGNKVASNTDSYANTSFRYPGTLTAGTGLTFSEKEAIKAAFGIKGTLSSDPKQNSGSLGVKVIF